MEIGRNKDNIVRVEQKAREGGIVEGKRQLVREIISTESGPSLLDTAVSVLESHRRGENPDKIAIRMAEKLMKTLEKNQFRLLGWNKDTGFETTTNDFDKHINFEKLSPGDKVVVKEVGVMHGFDIVRKPVVTKA